MHAATSDTLGPQIAAAIGISTYNLVSFTLRFQPGEIFHCDAEYLVDDHAATGITQLMSKSYTVTERTDQEPSHHTAQHCSAGP